MQLTATQEEVCANDKEWTWEEAEVWGLTPPLMLNWYLEVNEAVKKRWAELLWVHTNTHRHGKSLYLQAHKDHRCKSVEWNLKGSSASGRQLWFGLQFTWSVCVSVCVSDRERDWWWWWGRMCGKGKRLWGTSRGVYSTIHMF